MNCWKPKSNLDMAISSQAFVYKPYGTIMKEGSETIREDEVHNKYCGSARHLFYLDEDIVRSLVKIKAV